MHHTPVRVTALDREPSMETTRQRYPSIKTHLAMLGAGFPYRDDFGAYC